VLYCRELLLELPSLCVIPSKQTNTNEGPVSFLVLELKGARFWPLDRLLLRKLIPAFAVRIWIGI